ncbi:MAG: hypothetical protein IKR22_05755, partial [Clostridiales bacterium]|nr:hypothetical protein [Clostridiales bacterium]
ESGVGAETIKPYRFFGSAPERKILDCRRIPTWRSLGVKSGRGFGLLLLCRTGMNMALLIGEKILLRRGSAKGTCFRMPEFA